MNAGIGAEDVLSRFKLREPSSGLKNRIAEATRGEWGGSGNVVEYRVTIWRMVASLAAAVLIIVAGGVVNDAILSRPELAKQDSSEAVEMIEIVDGPVGLMGTKLFRSFGRGVDASCFTKVRKALIRELGENADDSIESRILPGQLMRYFMDSERERQEVLT